MLGGVTIIPGVYIFVNTVNFFEDLSLAYRGGIYEMDFTETRLGLGVYRYILNRWVKVVFELFLRLTPGVHGTTRVWISAHVGYICIRRRTYRRPTIYNI